MILALSFVVFCAVQFQVHGTYFEGRADDSGAPWDYGEHGPDTWSEHYKGCAGTNQSPIYISNRSNDYKRVDGKLNFTGYDIVRSGMVLVNKGYTVELKFSDDDEDPACISGAGLGATYCFRQLHFHWGLNIFRGTEHIIESERSHMMEMHLVHTLSTEDENSGAPPVAVLGVLFQPRFWIIPNFRYLNITSELPKVVHKGQTATLNGNVRLSDLLPWTHQFSTIYRYNGSLTTPPCTEGVVWNVYRDPEVMSLLQWHLFRQLNSTIESDPNQKPIAPNYRPLQELHDRPITRYGFDWRKDFL